MKLDRTDHAILDLLQRDAASAPAHRRAGQPVAVTLLAPHQPPGGRQGLIRAASPSSTAVALGMDVVVFATVNLTATGRQNLLSFEQEIVRYPEVMECYTMTGIWDYMLKIVTRDIRHYEQFVRDTLSANPSVRELHSHMAVTEIKNSTALPLQTQG
jgi:Lrp/AsnC family transcriptional regulator